MKVSQDFKLTQKGDKFGFSFKGFQIAPNEYQMVWPLDNELIGLFKNNLWQIVNLRGYFVTHTLYKNITIPGSNYIQMIDYENWFTETDNSIPAEIILQVLSINKNSIFNYNDMILTGKIPPFFPDSGQDEYFRFKRADNTLDLISDQWEMISEGEFNSVSKVIGDRYAVVNKAKFEWLHDFKNNSPISSPIYMDDYESKISFDDHAFTINHPSEGIKVFDFRKEEWK